MFFWTTVFLHITSLLIAMLVENIDTVFNFSGAIGSSALMFLFPGLGYILALRQFGKPHLRQRCETTFYLIMAWMFLVFYVLAVAIYMYSLVRR